MWVCLILFATTYVKRKRLVLETKVTLIAPLIHSLCVICQRRQEHSISKAMRCRWKSGLIWFLKAAKEASYRAIETAALLDNAHILEIELGARQTDQLVEAHRLCIACKFSHEFGNQRLPMFRPSKPVDSIWVELLSRALQKQVPHLAQWVLPAIDSHLVGQASLAAMSFASEIIFAEL